MTMPREPTSLLESTGYLLARAGSESRRRFVEALATERLTLGAYSIVMLLGGIGEMTQRELGDAAGIDPRNLVPILDDVEERGLLSRGEHRTDRRRHAVRLTPAGKAHLARLAKVGADAEASLLEPLSSSERKQLRALLSRLL